MQLSSNSELFFKREPYVGWRFHFDCSAYTHVKLVQLNVKPGAPRQRICHIYCNLVSKTITDPFGTLTVVGGSWQSARESGLFWMDLDDSFTIYIYFQLNAHLIEPQQTSLRYHLAG